MYPLFKKLLILLVSRMKHDGKLTGKLAEHEKSVVEFWERLRRLEISEFLGTGLSED